MYVEWCVVDYCSDGQVFGDWVIVEEVVKVWFCVVYGVVNKSDEATPT